VTYTPRGMHELGRLELQALGLVKHAHVPQEGCAP
jgi:hypothetical protein